MLPFGRSTATTPPALRKAAAPASSPAPVKIPKAAAVPSSMSGPTQPETWDYLTHGLCPGGGFTELLSLLLQQLQYRHLPIYRCRKTGDGDLEAWTAEVFLYARQGEFEARTFRPEHQRSTSISAVQEAARLAIARLCDIHSDLIVSTPFRFFPYLREEGSHCAVRSTAAVEDPCLAHVVQLTRALDSEYGESLKKITELRHALAASKAGVETLRSQLNESEATLATVERERMAAVSALARATTVTPIAEATVAATVQTTTPAGGSTSTLRQWPKQE